MKFMRNKYIGLVFILLAVVAAGSVRTYENFRISREAVVYSARESNNNSRKFKEAITIARLHQSHFKRHRFQLDGWLPVTQDTMLPIVTGISTVARVQDLSFSTPLTDRLRGPPTV
jgi:hypothetical protein